MKKKQLTADKSCWIMPVDGMSQIDGKLNDWDHSGKEWLALSREVADRFSGEVMVMYDDDALYLAAAAHNEIHAAENPTALLKAVKKQRRTVL